MPEITTTPETAEHVERPCRDVRKRSVFTQARSVAGAAKRGGLMLSRAAVEAMRRKLAQRVPPKPTVIQFPVNDICNSRCGMCNIWQQKRDHELTPDALATILRDPLFTEVMFVGLNGGEPTLRKDLPDLAAVLADELPKLKELHAITNAIKHGQVTERLLAVNEVARQRGKRFSVSVSLDGVGEDHDRNRGVPGNFASAVKVIEALKAGGVPVSIGCTLTPVNCEGADDLLAWCEENGIEDYEFRLGVEIRRVYNEGYDLLNPLTSGQRFHLTMFFDKLSRDERVGAAQRRFYKSLVDQIAFGKPRSAGCHWQTQGVTLDTRGGLSYCSVKSPVIGSALEASAQTLYTQGLPIRRAIVSKACADCRHDLLGPVPIRELVKSALDEMSEPWRRRIAQAGARRGADLSGFTPGQITHPVLTHPARWRRVVITGWYGTETQGDKAILGELVHFLRSHNPSCAITLTTIDRKVSEQTLREMPELKGVELIELAGASQSRAVAEADAVILGGGPLEDIGETEHVCRVFLRANELGRARVIFGCGVGPFHDERVKAQASAILRTATAGFFRDQESHDYAVRLGASPRLGVGCDPALRYLHRWSEAYKAKQNAANRGRRLVGLVRANTCEYVADLTPAQLASRNAGLTGQLASVFEDAADRHDMAVDLLPMHALPLGGDDRLYNRRIAKAFDEPARARVERGYLTLNGLLSSLAGADAAVAMRYHGHLFCMALGVPMLSIDYTGASGKVAALVKRIGYGDRSVRWSEFNALQAGRLLDEVIAHRGRHVDRLKRHTMSLVVSLEKAYEQAFGVTVPDKTPCDRAEVLECQLGAAA